MTTILVHGAKATIDEDLVEILGTLKWHLCDGYAVRDFREAPGKPRKKIWMHHVVTGQPLHGLMVDHINGNRLDNRKTNLRFVTNQQNNCNRRKENDHSSKFRGVYYVERLRKYVANIKCNGKTFYLGCFTNASDAAERYNQEAIKLFGEYANPNLREEKS